MKKRVFALVCALVLMFAMSINVFAATSADGAGVADSSEDASATIGSQTITDSTLSGFASNTKVSSSVNATIGKVSMETAKAAIAQAKAVVGPNATIATIVDLSVPEGTGTATFTLTCGVAAGQNVTILHQKSNGSWEVIKPSDVSNGSVTFTLSSYSPVAVVVNGTAPKTADMVLLVAGIAVVCLAGATVFGRKAKLS